MNKSLYISHVLYKVNDLNKSVNEFIKEGFHVEFGSKKNPHNALIYFSEGPYIELIKAPPVSKFSKMLLKLMGKQKLVDRFNNWENSKPGYFEICLETYSNNFKNEINMKIITLLPAATEIICDLGLSQNLCGISHECDYPLHVKDKIRVTSSIISKSTSQNKIDSIVKGAIEQSLPLFEIDNEKILEVCEIFQLFEKINEDVLIKQVTNTSLSSGQMQKIGFIRAILSDVEILLLDESTSNLDVTTKSLIFQILENKNITIINSTHDPTSFLKVKAQGGARTLSIQPSAIAGSLKFQIGAIIVIISLFSILSL